MSDKSATRATLEMSPTYGLALSFAVLLEGVTSGDAPKNPEALMYTVAAALLGVSGVSLLASDLAREAGKPNKFGMDNKVSRWSWIVLAIASTLTIQILGLILGYQVCSRGSPGIGGVFVLSIIGSLFLFTAVNLTLGYGLVFAMALRALLRRLKLKVPRVLVLFIDALAPTSKGVAANGQSGGGQFHRPVGPKAAVRKTARPSRRTAPAGWRPRYRIERVSPGTKNDPS